MAAIKINNLSFEFDIFELENARKYRDGLENVAKAMKEAQSKTDFVESIELQCYAIFDFIDLLFGDGVHKQIFGNSVNLRTCLGTYKSVIEQITKAIQETE